MPNRGGDQALPAFIGFIHWVKKSDRIGYMDKHRQSKLSGGFPDGSKARIVHIHQHPGCIRYPQTQSLPDLQTLSPAFFLNPQPAGCPIREGLPFYLPLVPIHAAEYLETLGTGLFEMIEMRVEKLFAPASIQVDQTHDPAASRLSSNSDSGRLSHPPPKSSPRWLCASITGKCGFFHIRSLGNQFALGEIIFEIHMCYTVNTLIPFW